MRERRPLMLALLVLAPLLAASPAYALDDCPPGSVQKSQDGFTWCEPTVCSNDGQCNPSEVCRPVGLCMQVGTLSNTPGGDGGQRLVVTQRCAPDKTCPQKQTCSDLNRCVSKAAAEKMGLLGAASAAPAGGGTEPKKSSCGCDAVGARHEGGIALAIGSLVVLASRRRRRTT